MTAAATEAWDDGRLRRKPEADEFEVRTGPYDGPLRELVDLAEARRLDVDAVPLGDLCAQYEVFAALVPDDLVRRAEPVPLVARITQIRAARLAGRAFTDHANASSPARPSRDAERVAVVRAWAAALDARERRGRDVFGNGRHRRRADGTVVRIASGANLAEIYGALVDRSQGTSGHAPEHVADDVAAALLTGAFAREPGDWLRLADIVACSELPPGPCYAALLRAALYAAGEGEAELRQAAPLAPIEARSAPGRATKVPTP